MTISRQQPHAIAKFKHLIATSTPKAIKKLPPKQADWQFVCMSDWYNPGSSRPLAASEKKRRAARAKRKSSK